MGNAATKEARPSSLRHGQTRSHHDTDSSRARGSPDRSFLGGLSSNDRGASSEPRRETRQEREARKREKERAARIKERERSMKEEHVDGGYLVTQGVYVGTEDFNKPIVRQLMIERRIAPFWRGLNEFSTSWAEHQIMAAARGLPIPPADEVPPELEYKAPPPVSQEDRQSDKFLNTLTIPIASRSQSFNSDSSAGARKTTPQCQSSANANASGSQLFRGRAKTLASLTTSSKSNSNMAPREFQLPNDPFVNGQPIEVYLYKDPIECPICFLYYPPYLNKTRCCDQPICSECFVQIKRADPHPPEHEQPGTTSPGETDSQTNDSDHQLVTEPAACPFCVQPEFGVTYTQPPFRRGLAYAPGHSNTHPLANVASPMSSSSSLNSANASPGTTTTRRRATSLSADAPGVITTDKIRPDWAQKLATARANAARRSAAATALHTAAYLMNNNNNNNSTSGSNGESRNLASIGRRALLRRGTGNDSPTSRSNSTHINAFAYLAERRANERLEGDDQPNNTARGNSRRERSRAEEIEEMMVMEAIRLSLTSEEERRKKEEKAKKEAKKREKDSKKGGKCGEEASSNSGNNSTLNVAAPIGVACPEAEPLGNTSSTDKGKGVARPACQVESSRIPDQPPKLTLNTPLDGESSVHAGNSPKTHLRPHSSASSSDISLVESAFDDQKDTGTPNGSAPNIDAVFNFRSLAAMVGDAENADQEHTEHSSSPVPIGGQADDSRKSEPQRESSKPRGSPLEVKEAQSQSTEMPSQSPISSS
ncbi:SNF1-interacting protein [Microsporum audouinii]